MRLEWKLRVRYGCRVEIRMDRHRWTNNKPMRVAARRRWCYAFNCVPEIIAWKLP